METTRPPGEGGNSRGRRSGGLIRRWLWWLGALLLLLGGLWLLSAPQRTPDSALAGLPADPVRGEQLFRAAGCADCHASLTAGPDAGPVAGLDNGASAGSIPEGAARLRLGGGRALPAAQGIFYAPNISPDLRHGIGGWSTADLVSALRHGTAPDGRHYFPAFPYPAFRHMTLEDAVALDAYLRTLPPVATPSRPHDLRPASRWRRPLGLWKRLVLREGWAVDPVPAEAETGRYLAEALARCGACHTPRGRWGGPAPGLWLAGTPAAPNLTPAALDWSDAALLTYFQTGITPGFTQAQGEMAPVIAALSTLPQAQLLSLVAYLRAVPPVAGAGGEPR